MKPCTAAETSSSLSTARWVSVSATSEVASRDHLARVEAHDPDRIDVLAGEKALRHGFEIRHDRGEDRIPKLHGTTRTIVSGVRFLEFAQRNRSGIFSGDLPPHQPAKAANSPQTF
jgi:hypothetical protein